jgi:hypothetical protein
MYITRWAEKHELLLIAEYWYKMQSEMGERDDIPIQSKERIHEIQNLFLKEYESKNLKFRIAINNHGKIVACAGGLLRLEYFAPLSEKQSLFG